MDSQPVVLSIPTQQFKAKPSSASSSSSSSTATTSADKLELVVNSNASNNANTSVLSTPHKKRKGTEETRVPSTPTLDLDFLLEEGAGVPAEDEEADCS